VAERFAIAIDGPASSGKGTVARLVARELDLPYVDTGAMYRAAALLAERQGIAWDDGVSLAALITDMDFQLGWTDGAFSLHVDGEDLSRAIRTERVGQGASAVAKLPRVRDALLETQRALAYRGAVMDGRDIGTVVLPDAPLKVFLDADLDVRARRRQAELAGRGIERTFSEIRLELERRDTQDRSRETAPLAQADDAVYLNSTHRTPEQVARVVVAMARARSGS
jgi:cytidylate kinase